MRFVLGTLAVAVALGAHTRLQCLAHALARVAGDILPRHAVIAQRVDDLVARVAALGGVAALLTAARCRGRRVGIGATTATAVFAVSQGTL
jgi:hypothetical protein